jgi:hypothetical protein
MDVDPTFVEGINTLCNTVPVSALTYEAPN